MGRLTEEERQSYLARIAELLEVLRDEERRLEELVDP